MLILFIVGERRHLISYLEQIFGFNISDRQWTPATPSYVSTPLKLPEAITQRPSGSWIEALKNEFGKGPKENGFELGLDIALAFTPAHNLVFRNYEGGKGEEKTSS